MSYWHSQFGSGDGKLPGILGASVSCTNQLSSDFGVAGDLFLYQSVALGDQPIVEYKGVLFERLPSQPVFSKSARS